MRWDVPTQVELRDSVLDWTKSETPWGVDTDLCGPTEDLLGAFVSLARARDGTIERFARNFGQLRRMHSPLTDDAPENEPIEAWRDLANDVGLLLGAATTGQLSGLHRLRTMSFVRTDVRIVLRPTTQETNADGRRLPPFDPRQRPLLRPFLDLGPIYAWSDSPTSLAEVFGAAWLRFAGARTVFIPGDPLDGRRAAVELRPDSLNGALALQFCQTLAGVHGLVLCSGCGESFHPERQPTVGRASWCKVCRKSGTHRKRAERARRQGLADRPSGHEARDGQRRGPLRRTGAAERQIGHENLRSAW